MSEIEKVFSWIEGEGVLVDGSQVSIDLWAKTGSVEECDSLLQSYLPEFGVRTFRISQERLLGTLSEWLADQKEPEKPGFVPMSELQEAVSRVIESGVFVGLIDHGTRSELLPHRRS